MTTHRPSLLAPAMLVLASGLLALAPGARAQMIDDTEVRQEGADVVVRLRFVTPVRLVRSIAGSGSELALAYYEFQDVDGVRATAVPSERRIAAGKGLPTIVVTDESFGAQVTQRKLVVRTDPAAKVRIRSGADTRSLDVVLDGLGAKLQPELPVATTAAPATEAQRFQVVLQSSRDPSLRLSSPLPKELRQYTVSASQRVTDGGALYELNLGPFQTQVEANRALDLLRKRFPQAKVARLVPAGATASTPAAGESVADAEAAASALLFQVRAAEGRGDTLSAIDALSKLLDLPPNRLSREAQARIGPLWLKIGDPVRARREFELFLKLYPTGPDADRVRAQLASLPAAPTTTADSAAAKPPGTTTFTGSVGMYYYGGQSQVRSEEFKESPLSGLPELVQNPTISGTDQKLALGSVDMNYRHRDVEQDFRFVFRDNYQANLMEGKPDRNKLTALYADYKSIKSGASIRAGRQSPLGGGVLGRFDGVTAGYTFAPKWKVNVVGGQPSDRLQETRRYFYGTSIDADALTDNVGGSLYWMEQRIDGETDRRAVGTDLRFFNQGTFISGNLDYDTVLKAFNVAAVQGTWQNIDAEGNVGTSINFMLDRRAQPLLMLGNALFFQDPNGGVIPVTLKDALALRDLQTLREYVRTTTAYSNQGVFGVTTPLTSHWQVGGDIRMSKIDAIPAVPDILPDGQPATGNIWTYGAQLIGTNLYSKRDTHVLNVSYQKGPSFKGGLVLYNNVSAINETWQLEPSVQYYRQGGPDGISLSRWKPGLRLTMHATSAVVLETAADYEVTRIRSAARNENTNRVFYYLGGRYEF